MNQDGNSIFNDPDIMLELSNRDILLLLESNKIENLFVFKNNKGFNVIESEEGEVPFLLFDSIEKQEIKDVYKTLMKTVSNFQSEENKKEILESIFKKILNEHNIYKNGKISPRLNEFFEQLKKNKLNNIHLNWKNIIYSIGEFDFNNLSLKNIVELYPKDENFKKEIIMCTSNVKTMQEMFNLLKKVDIKLCKEIEAGNEYYYNEQMLFDNDIFKEKQIVINSMYAKLEKQEI